MLEHKDVCAPFLMHVKLPPLLHPKKGSAQVRGEEKTVFEDVLRSVVSF